MSHWAENVSAVVVVSCCCSGGIVDDLAWIVFYSVSYIINPRCAWAFDDVCYSD